MPTDFPARLRQERSRLGLTTRQAAELLGVRQQTYCQLEELPARDPRLSTLVRLSEAGFIAPRRSRLSCSRAEHFPPRASGRVTSPINWKVGYRS